MINFKLIREANPLPEVFEKYNLAVEKSGDQYHVLECPFCGGHDCFRTFANNTKWSCFQCDDKRGLDVVDFVRLIEDISSREAIIKLGDGLDFGEIDKEDSEIQLVKLFALNYYKDVLTTSIDKKFKMVIPDKATVMGGSGDSEVRVSNQVLRRYFESVRGLSMEFLLENGVGFSDGNLVSTMREVGISDTLITRSGLFNPDIDADYFPKNSTIFTHFVNGEISHFSCDKTPLKNKKPLKSKAMFMSEKYVYYLQDTVDRNSTAVYLTEGCWDGLSVLNTLKEINPHAGVYTMDGQISSKQLEGLAKLDVPLVELFDGDNGGKTYRNAILKHVGIDNVYDVTPGQLGTLDICDWLAVRENKVKDFRELIKNASDDPKTYKIEKDVSKESLLAIDKDKLKNINLEMAVLKTIFEKEEFGSIQKWIDVFDYKPHRAVLETSLGVLSEAGVPDINILKIKLNFRDDVIDDIIESPSVDLDQAYEVLVWYKERRLLNGISLKLLDLVREDLPVENLRQSALALVNDYVIDTYIGDDLDTITSSDIPEKMPTTLPEDGFDKVLSGFDNLDMSLVFGYAPGNITVIGGRTGAGKSLLKLNKIKNQCELGYGVLNYVPENGIELEQLRMDSLMLNISGDVLLEAEIGDEIYKAREGNWEHIKDNWAYVCSAVDVSVGQIVMDITKYKAEFPDVQNWLVYIDMLDYMTELSNPSDRWFKIGKIMRKLKRIGNRAKLNFSPVVLVHIGRAASQNMRGKTAEEKRPTLHELKGSGDLEGVADLVLLVHREALYDRNKEDDVLEVEIAKQRGGGATEIKCFTFTPAMSSLIPLDRDDEDGELGHSEHSDFAAPEL